MAFLSPDVEIPKSSSRYTKFQEGQNRFRALSDVIIGYIYWNTENKPVRLREKPKGNPHDMRAKNPKTGKPEKVSYFWLLVVWDYREEEVKIMELTQITIMEALKSLAFSDWGDPKGYDIIITKTTQGDRTTYNVINQPPKDLAMEVAEAYAKEDINLSALYDGADPFNTPKEEAVFPPEPVPVDIGVDGDPMVEITNL